MRQFVLVLVLCPGRLRGLRGLAGRRGRLVFPHRRMELVVDDGVLLVGAGGEGERRAGLHLERHVPGNIEEDRVAATRRSHQDGDLLGLTGLHGWRGSAGFGLLRLLSLLGLLGLLVLRCCGVGSHAARGRVDGQEHLLRTNLGNLQIPPSNTSHDTQTKPYLHTALVQSLPQ